MTPIVKVIAYSHFVGVPTDLLPNELMETSIKKGQDRGSESARLVETAGRCCYDSFGQGRPSSEYHQHIKEVGHGSVTEHATISFYLDNISRGCTHELVRHRAGCAISQRSTRYVDESSSEWVYHPLVHKYGATDPLLMERVNEVASVAKSAYDFTVQTLEANLIRDGVDKFTARKQARGAARGLLGNALCTSLVWTANIRALRGCIEQRASPHADAEIRVLFNKIYEACITVAPEYFNDYEKVECIDGIGYGLVTKYRKI